MKRTALLVGLLCVASVAWAADILTRTVVTTTTDASGFGTAYSYQRKVFRAAGLYWAFYADGTNHVYRTSADGVTWSGSTTVVSGSSQGHRMGLYFDGTYIHYAFCAATDGADLMYRRGTPGTDGLITWSAVEQTALAIAAGKIGGYPTVWADTTGAPWVGFIHTDAPGFTQPYLSKVIKSSATDGTWSTDAGFPKQFISNTSVFPIPVCVPQTSGKVFCIYSSDDGAYGTPYYGDSWNGSAWAGQESVTTIFSAHNQYGLVPDGDVVHMTFEDVPNKKIYYRKRSAAGSWGTEIEMTSGANAANWIPTITLIAPDHVRIYWATANVLKYRDVVAGTAGPIASYSEAGDTLTSGLAIQVTPSGATPLLVYTTKGASPYDIVALRQNAAGTMFWAMP